MTAADRPEVDDPRVLALAKARQQLAHDNPFNAGFCPPWEALSEQEQRLSLLDARNYLRAALKAGLCASSAVSVVPPATNQTALRDRIAEALISWTYRGKEPDPETGMLETVRANAYSRADAVLAVLPETGRAAALAEDLRYALGHNEPGHSHEEPGVWDTSGEPCGHCARLAVARQNLAAYDGETEAGQAGEDRPETPLEKRLRYSERRNDELRAESLRRGKVKLEYAEKIVALERQIDDVRSQLGAEILRAGQAEAELRRLADEEQAGGPSLEATEEQPDAQLLAELQQHLDEHTPSCNARTDHLMRRAAWALGLPRPAHVGGNAEDCPGCEGTNPPYPFTCPSPPAVSSRPGTEQEA